MGRKKKNNKFIYAVILIILGIATYFGLNITEFENFNNIENYIKNISDKISNSTNSLENLTAEAVKGEDVIVSFIDVGQADSIFIQSDGETMLIDAGTNDKGSTVVKYLENLGINKIDYLVGTHPHEDHIGGLDDVIDNFEIGTIYMPKVQTNTKTFEDVLDSISKKNLSITSPNVGDTFQIGNAKCQLICSATGTNLEKDNLNLSSIVIRMVYGNQSFLFTGDAEIENEEQMEVSKTTVLKVAHHGSDTSSSEEFLEKVDPEIAVISVGEGNTYNHPNQTVIYRLNKIGAKIYRTDKQGTITIVCDGEKCEVTTEK